MFWRKKQEKFYWPLYFFGLIALAIIVSVACILLILLRKAVIVDNVPAAPSVSQNQGRELPFYQGNLLLDYTNSVKNLKKVLEFEFQEDAKAALIKAESELFSMRVPAEYLDYHFNAAMALRNLSRSADSLTDEQIGSDLLRVLSLLESNF